MTARSTVFATLVALGLAAACSGGESPAVSGTSDGGGARPENTGRSCVAPADCYPGLDAGTLRGEVQCLDRVPGGYCTHLCETDADCCAVSGECDSDLRQVCSPFESTGLKMCFLSCEGEDLRSALDAGADGGELDGTTYCTSYAASGFRCRSSGGGRENRKVCVP
ncbi:MAG: hypothetical protein KF894_27550 [Labilithrix sp.]|nr:hypothetical protein [Labilithrix sp.]